MVWCKTKFSVARNRPRCEGTNLSFADVCLILKDCLNTTFVLSEIANIRNLSLIDSEKKSHPFYQ